MEKRNQEPEELLNKAVELLRREELPEDQVRTRAEEVRTRLREVDPSLKGIEGCDEFQALIPDFLSGGLSGAKRLLVEDHTRGCVVCRKYVTALRTKQIAQRPQRPSMPVHPWVRWGALAAGLVLAVLLFQMAAWNGLIPGLRMTVAALEEATGPVFLISEEGLEATSPGDTLAPGEYLRTGKAGSALVRLNDGSVVEMGERTELAVHEGWRSRTVRLGRGQIIVEAAQQKSGQLLVSTDDCRVSVKGTVFSVNHGMSGSRVAVLKGEVWVEKAGENTVLKPGEQFTSRSRLQNVSLETEFAWSVHSSDHLSLLNELTALHRDLNAASFGEHLRFSSDLIGYLPGNTVVYGALPNVAGQLEEVYQLFRERMLQNPVLAEHFQQHPEAIGEMSKFDELVAKLRSFGDLVGEEVVVALVAQDEARRMAPLLLTTAVDEERFLSLARAEATQINTEADRVVIQVVNDPSQASPNAEGVVVSVRSRLVLASPSIDLLNEISALTSSTTVGAFAETSLFQSVAQSYGRGVDWLLAADLHRLLSLAPEVEGEERLGEKALASLGLAEVRDLIIERKQQEGISESRAVLTYDGEGKGMISWIAAPGPMGALDYVSANASLAAAFVVRDPVELVDDLAAILSAQDPEATAAMARFEATEGVSIRNDIAAPLGGEFVFAVDGPVFPTPAWKAILEVYDPGTLQRTIAWAVERVNRAAAEEGDPGPVLTLQESASWGLYQLRAEKTGTSVYYRYVNGYMIAAPDPALISQAEQYRSSGYSLRRSGTFVSLLPPDSSVNLSGFYYQNLAPVLDSVLSSGLAESLAGTGEGQEVLQSLRSTPPVLVGLYSEPNQVILAGSGDFERLWMNLGLIATLGGPEGIQKIVTGQMQP